MRLSLSGGKQPDHREAELYWLTQEMAKKRKVPLKELRARLELRCGSSWDSSRGSADPGSK
jgi:hypothetical protein